MKQFIIRLAAMAAMTAAIVACDKENLDPAPDNGRNESIVELTLKNESAADRTRAFGAGTTEAWEKSISSAVLIVYNASGTQIIIENGFFRGWSQQKIKAEEQHQR